MEYSTEQELGDFQKKLIETAGETLYMIQIAELSIKNCITCVFDNVDSLFDRLLSQEEKARKKTLGQLISEIKNKTNLHPEFESILNSFLSNRNIFVHEIFIDQNLGITSNDNCQKVQSLLLTLQELASKVQILFFGWLIEWARQNNLDNHFPESIKEDFLFQQVNQTSFSQLLKNLKDNKES